MDTYNIIKPLACAKGWYSKTLPAGFDDSVSYLQMLSAILAKQNEIIKQLNINTEFIKNWDKTIDELTARVDALSLELSEFKDDVPIQIQNACNELATELLDIINGRMIELKGYVDVEVNRLDERIDNVAIGQINLYDPTTGLISPIQQVINNLYDTSRDDALTATEFDALDLTATEFEAYNITASDFDLKGKLILV